jgi:hypothetical protein
MAKRKAPARRRSTAGPKRAALPKRRTASRKATARKPVRRAAKAARAKAPARKVALKAMVKPKTKAVAKSRLVKRATQTTAKKATKQATKKTTKRATKGTTAPKRAATKPIRLVKIAPVVPVRAAAPKAPRTAGTAARKKHALGLDRERRILGEEVIQNTPPSSLALDRTASSARTGRQELRERYDNHNETSPALTGGDVDADWESAYSTGDEAPGGDNPTPDQNNVDDIGVALGVEYADNEELEGAEKIEERDRHRWEDDPASSEDFDDR